MSVYETVHPLNDDLDSILRQCAKPIVDVHLHYRRQILCLRERCASKRALVWDGDTQRPGREGLPHPHRHRRPLRNSRHTHHQTLRQAKRIHRTVQCRPRTGIPKTSTIIAPTRKPKPLDTRGQQRTGNITERSTGNQATHIAEAHTNQRHRHATHHQPSENQNTGRRLIHHQI